MWGNEIEFSTLKGMTFTKIEGGKGDEEIIFHANDGRKFKLYHYQNCCESVSVEDVCGNIDDLVGHPILLAEEFTNSDENPPDAEIDTGRHASFTWTFYKLATVKGHVTIRWYGGSNGCYSESVDLVEITESN
jgi:hypothetical protein